MRDLGIGAVSIGVMAVSPALAAGDVDMQAVQLWSKTKVANYHIVGVYNARTVIAYKDAYGQGDVTDGITLDFNWDINAGKIVGDVKITNETSKTGKLAGLRDYCKPPIPKGQYEHFTGNEVRATAPQRIDVVGTRHYGDIEVAGCEADQSYHHVAAKDEPVTEYVPVPNPMMLAVPAGQSGNVTVAADHKSFVVKAGGWTFTMTPRPVS